MTITRDDISNKNSGVEDCGVVSEVFAHALGGCRRLSVIGAVES